VANSRKTMGYHQAKIDKLKCMKVSPIWKNNKNFMEIAELLNKEGISFYLVGGAVRSAVIKSKTSMKDIDLTTSLVPEKIKQHLKNTPEITILCDAEQFGTLRLIYKKESYEITTFRKDIITNGRHAKIAFTKSMEEDAKRRDFSFNALYADLDGRLYDPLGRGLDDLVFGRVRFVGNIEKRLEEDYLRLLRLFRFQAMLGKRPLPRSYRKIITQFIPKIKYLSKERRWQELSKLLKLPSAYKTLCIMYRWGVLEALFCKCQPPYRMKYFFSERLAAFFPIMVLVFLNIREEELPLTKKEKKKYKKYVAAKKLILNSPSKKTLFKIAQDFSENETLGMVLLFLGKKLKIKRLKIFLKELKNRKFPLTSEILIQHFSIPPSRQVGDTLKKVNSEWIEKLGYMDLKECMRYVECITGKQYRKE